MSDVPSSSSAALVEDQPKVVAEAKVEAEAKLETEAKTETETKAEDKKEEKEVKLGGPEEELTEKMMLLKLKAADDTVFEVYQDVAFKSRLIKNMMVDLGITADDHEKLAEPLPITNVNGKTLKKILEYCEEKKKEEYKPKEEKDDPRIQLTQWDNQYMDISSEELMDLLTGANYLDIPGIIDITTQKIANMADGKTVEELRELFGLVNDFTEAEAAEIKARFAWVEQ